MENELHAFDLTWRNYIPSLSDFYCCSQKKIQLTDDEPVYFNVPKKKKKSKRKKKKAYNIIDDAEFLDDDQISSLIQDQNTQFYAAKSIPDIHFDFDENEPSSSSQPLIPVQVAQTLLSDKLDDLTEKLTFIKNNIIQIQNMDNDDDDDDDDDTTTLHTIYNDHQESHVNNQ